MFKVIINAYDKAERQRIVIYSLYTGVWLRFL